MDKNINLVIQNLYVLRLILVVVGAIIILTVKKSDPIGLEKPCLFYKLSLHIYVCQIQYKHICRDKKVRFMDHIKSILPKLGFSEEM